jgi:hypothetical protein
MPGAVPRRRVRSPRAPLACTRLPRRAGQPRPAFATSQRGPSRGWARRRPGLGERPTDVEGFLRGLERVLAAAQHERSLATSLPSRLQLANPTSPCLSAGSSLVAQTIGKCLQSHHQLFQRFSAALAALGVISKLGQLPLEFLDTVGNGCNLLFIGKRHGSTPC